MTPSQMFEGLDSSLLGAFDETLKNGYIRKLEGYHLHGKTYDAEGNLVPDAPPHDQDCPCCRKDLFGSKENDDRQRLHIEVVFNTRQNPGSLLHLREVLKGYLAPRGITLRDDLTINI